MYNSQLRGVFLLVSLLKPFESLINNEFLLTGIVILCLAITEMIPFYLSLDWGTISILLTNFSEERLVLPESDSFNSKTLIERNPLVEKYFLNYRDVTLKDELVSDSEFSVIFKGVYVAQEVSVRKFQLHEIGSEQAIDELGEMMILYGSVDHANILQFFGVYRIGLNLFVVNEYIKRGSLADIIANSNIVFDQKLVVKIAKQICRAFSFLHSRRRPNPLGIIHGNLCSRNVLVFIFSACFVLISRLMIRTE